MRKFIITILFFSVLGFTPTVFVFAQEDTQNLEDVILELREQIKTLQEEIDKLKLELTNIKTELMFTETLHQGVSGDEVRDLQEFLAQFPDIYPKGLITGYFGPLTETAVQKLQEKHGIVSDGTVSTTGYGQVGPKTRSKLNELRTDGAGKSGVIPPGLIRAPGLGSDTATSTATATTTPSTSTTTPSGTTPAVPATPPSGGGGSATPATPAVPAEPDPEPDTNGPWITALSITPTSGVAGTEITFSVTAEDATGVLNVTYDISYPGSSYVLKPNCNFTQPEYTVGDTCTFAESIDHGISPTLLGDYTIVIRAVDTLSNLATYTADGTASGTIQDTHSLTIPAITISAPAGTTTPPSTSAEALQEILDDANFNSTVSSLISAFSAFEDNFFLDNDAYWQAIGSHDTAPEYDSPTAPVNTTYNPNSESLIGGGSWGDSGLLPGTMPVSATINTYVAPIQFCPDFPKGYRIILTTQNEGFTFSKAVRPLDCSEGGEVYDWR